MKNIHVVPHTHWDREWYFTAEESRVILVYFMEELLELLERDEKFKYFVLDGQSIILDDYLELVPENRKRIKELVQKGKLIIGPWFTQTDEMVVGGESIVRNLYYGIKRCKEFGDYMKIGYLPDSFGQSAQIPQILNGFGINKAIFWRGVYEKQTSNTEFIWKSPEGSEVFVVNLPLGYAIGKYLPSEIEAARIRIRDIVDRLKIKATTDNILIPNGHDQMPVQKDLTSIIDGLNEIDKDNNYIISNYDKYIEDVKASRKNFDAVQGELIYPKYSRIHRSIFSTRYDIKKKNADIEYTLTNYVEPIASMVWSLGFLYPQGLIEKAWKEIMQNHAHDSMGCCNTDSVHKDVVARFKRASDLCNEILEINFRKIAEGVEGKREGEVLIVFNTLPYERSGVFKTFLQLEDDDFNILDDTGENIDFTLVSKKAIDMGTIDRRIAAKDEKLIFEEMELEIEVKKVPALGYKTLYIVPKVEKEALNNYYLDIGKENIIENSFYKVEANGDGTINVLDKANNRKLNSLMVFEESGDDGDEYNYSPPLKDYIITNKAAKAEIKALKGKVTKKLYITQSIMVPKDLKEREQGIVDIEIKLETVITLNKDSKLIDIKVKIDNKALSHRMRILFNSGVETKVSFADQQFGLIERVNDPEELELCKNEKWTEVPVPIYPMQSFVDINDGEYGLAVFTKGIREYEIVGNKFDTIAITLFRGVGYLGKSDLLFRPGRASGVNIETPDSQLLGNLEFEFSIYPHSGDTVSSRAANLAKEYVAPMISYKKTDSTVFVINKHNKKLPNEYSLLHMNSDLVLSAAKKAENCEGLILRVFNPSFKDSDGGSLLLKDLKKMDTKKIYNTDLNENIVEELSHKYERHDEIKLGNLKPCQLKTILIK